jgi:hypothetical protein
MRLCLQLGTSRVWVGLYLQRVDEILQLLLKVSSCSVVNMVSPHVCVSREVCWCSPVTLLLIKDYSTTSSHHPKPGSAAGVYSPAPLQNGLHATNQKPEGDEQ